jgi:hypothetical protein
MYCVATMKVSSLLAILPAIAFCLFGCGGGTQTPRTGPPVYPAITGNWSFTASTAVAGENVMIGGYLTNTNSTATVNSNTVTGTLHFLNSTCYTASQDIPVTGTISYTGALSLTSSSISSQVVTAAGTLTGTVMNSGTYSITGGCGNGDKGTVTGFLVPPFTNTYTGTFTSVSGKQTGATVTTTQTGPNSDGLYSVTGTATFTGSTCFSSGTISTGAVLGSYLAVQIATNNNGTVIFGGYDTDSTGKTVTGTYEVTSGICSGDVGTGSISHS